MSQTATAEKKNGNGKGEVKDARNNSPLKVIPGEPARTDQSKTDQKTEKQTPVFTVEQKKEKIFKLQLLSERHDQLKEEMKALEQFQISHDSDKCRLQISDDAGKTFKSNNPEAIKTMIEICKKSIRQKVENVESEIEL